MVSFRGHRRDTLRNHRKSSAHGLTRFQKALARWICQIPSTSKDGTPVQNAVQGARQPQLLSFLKRLSDGVGGISPSRRTNCPEELLFILEGHPASPSTSSSHVQASEGLGAAIWSQLLLRVASSAGALVIGSYFVDLQTKGVPITSLLIGVLTSLGYLSEFLFAPFAGALSDIRGRRSLLLTGPLLAAVAVLLLPTGSIFIALPPLGLVLVLVGVSRLVEGAGAAVFVPATLSLLAAGTDHDPQRRGRQMSWYELASSGGIALGAIIGPLLWEPFHVWSFVGVAVLYGMGGLLILFFVHEQRREERLLKGRLFDWRRYGVILTEKHLMLFFPAWIAVNAILGIWVTSLITFVLAGHLHVPTQRFVGSLYQHETVLSAYLGGYVLLFSVCVVAWAFWLGHLPKLPLLLLTLFGSILASLGLVGLNHGGTPLLFVPLVVIGVFLEAGFTPTALAYLADQSQALAQDRGLVMGLYSVILGVGYLLGNVLGGLFAQWLYFDGLALLTSIFAVIGILSIASLLLLSWSNRA